MQTLTPTARHALLESKVRAEVETFVSSCLGRPWAARLWQDKTPDASQACALLSDGVVAVFAKFAPDDSAADRFAQESFGLRLLGDRAGVFTPPVLGVLPLEKGAVLLMEAVVPVRVRSEADWRQLGRDLARIHGVKGPRFGLDRPGYWGTVRQDNQPADTWAGFYAERRLRPRLAAAVESGHLPPELIPGVEALAERLPQLVGGESAPCLLHGDAHQNNMLSTKTGPVFIDPSVHYGHPEVDLAYVDFFATVPTAFFDGYRDIGLIDPGFPQRRDLWRVHAWLAMIEHGDISFASKLKAALRAWL